jgi:hypothetical protein
MKSELEVKLALGIVDHKRCSKIGSEDPLAHG